MYLDSHAIRMPPAHIWMYLDSHAIRMPPAQIARIETEGTLFNSAAVNQMACPLVSFIDRAQEVEQQCCSGGECANGLPDECMFDCGRFFTSFLLDCNQSVHDVFPGPTVREYVAFGDECSRMDPLSMVRAIEGTVCSSCGDNHTDVPLEECDWGAGNSYEANSCRPGCRLPSCGDGVIDTECEEGCDDGEMNAEDGDCLPDCQLACDTFTRNGQRCLTGAFEDMWVWSPTQTLYLLPSVTARADYQQQFADACAALGLQPLDCSASASGQNGGPYNKVVSHPDSPGQGDCCVSDSNSPIQQHGWGDASVGAATFCQTNTRVYAYNTDSLSGRTIKFVCADSV
eukprot:COSAG06_NODE_2684_length_6454_cov_11.145712_2_plen_343_part_00